MQMITFPDGESVPALGQGTWMIGDSAATRPEEIASLRAGLDAGLRLIDTAEMYGEGASESLIGEAISGRRDECFLVSKVYPHNASRAGVEAACERSLKRLGTDRLDLYLLHWRGSVSLAETVAGFEALVKEGKIRRWGVSNFDAADMAELMEVAGGTNVQTNQVLYNLTRRGIEFDLLPASQRAGVPIMAYSPIEQARLARHADLARLATRLGTSTAALALAWVLDHPGVIAIPKAGSRKHLTENLRCLDIILDDATRAELDRLFPPPKGAVPLEML
jgi:diketogulonate reductase-like aldo/keto reductase